MDEVIYISKKIDFHYNESEFDFKTIFTEDFSEIQNKSVAVMISASDMENPAVLKLIKEQYPILLWNKNELQENNNKTFSEQKKKLNTYFIFDRDMDSSSVGQIVENYINFISSINEQKYLNSLKHEFTKQTNLNKEILKIGIALSSGQNNPKLLEYIVSKIRQLTAADAGSLYLLDTDKKSKQSSMLFKIAQNDSNPTDFTEFRMPIQKQSIAGYVAITGEVITLEDVYIIPEDGEYNFNKSYDDTTGYRTKSMLTVPMKNHNNKIIGVIQLINKKRDRETILSNRHIVDENVVSFTKADEELVLSLSSLAAVSLDNNQLYTEINNLFECLVSASVEAIEQRDPATSGHSLRVAKYTVALAEVISKDKEVFKDIDFSEEHLKGLRFACLLHDFGKIGVREHVLMKAKKLYPGMIEQIILRFDSIEKEMIIKNLEKLLALDQSDKSYEEKVRVFREEKIIFHEKITKYKEIVVSANEPNILKEEPEQTLSEIFHDKEHAYLTQDEYALLSIKKGSLSENERKEIMSHVVYTYDFLKNIPWPESIEWIPEIAKWHHETLDGFGYPDQKTGDQLPIESKMMAVADIFDALSACDRPYKEAMPLKKVIDILGKEAESGKLDKDIVNIFVAKKVYKIIIAHLSA